jgi:outer membrane protein OmpA-like peptidoglycan-associated protein
MLRSFRQYVRPDHAKEAEHKMNKMQSFTTPSAISALLLAASLGYPAVAQSSSPGSSTAQVQTGAAANASAQQSGQANPSDNSTYATGQPLSTQSNEGFWGKVNPFARKKWVKRQIDPVKDRLNELDQLQAKNAKDIKDVDARAQAGIHQAQSTADQASQTASTANSTAGQAQQTAQQASAETAKLNGTVSNLDQYQKVNDIEIRFRPGQTTLNDKAKSALDQVAAQMRGRKGYIVEIEGYSASRGQAGIQNSQHMADAVVRYLAENDIPVYRIHQVAMGNAKIDDSGTAPRGSVVRVSLLQNSLAALNSSPSGAGSPIGATQQSNAQPSPQGAASQPPAPQQQ